MALNTFNQANGTSLGTVDAKWVGSTTTLEVQSSVLQITNVSTFVDRSAWYSNGQTDTQESEVVIIPNYSNAAGQIFGPAVQQTGSVAGYQARIAQINLGIYRNGVFQAQAAHGMTVANSGNIVKITCNSATGVVNAYANSVLIATFTDGTPLTGGLPAIFINAAGVVASVGFVSWTDNVASVATTYAPSRLGSSLHPGKTMNAKARFMQTKQGIVPRLGVVFRKTLSGIGTRTGSRQVHN